MIVVMLELCLPSKKRTGRMENYSKKIFVPAVPPTGAQG
jgi:hypothetical protein